MIYRIAKLHGESLEFYLEKVNKNLISDEFVTKISNNAIIFKSPHNMMHSKVGNKYSYARLIKRGKVIIIEDHNEITFNFKIDLFFPIFFGIVNVIISSLIIIRFFDFPLILVVLTIMFILAVLMTYRIINNIDRIMRDVRLRKAPDHRRDNQ